MRYKLLALDTDGTIVKEHTDSASTVVIEAINKAKQHLAISLITGRAWQDQKRIIDLLDLPQSYHVSENGAKVINPAGILEYSRCILYDEIDEILTLANEFHHDVAFCINGKWEPYKSLMKASQISTISFISKNKALGLQISQALPITGRQYSVSVGSHWSEPGWAVTLISHKEASKGNGLAYVQKMLGVTPKETIAVGDGACDIPMMRYADNKVAMGNAEPELRQVANYIAPSVLEDGLADVIRRFILT